MGPWSHGGKEGRSTRGHAWVLHGSPIARGGRRLRGGTRVTPRPDTGSWPDAFAARSAPPSACPSSASRRMLAAARPGRPPRGRGEHDLGVQRPVASHRGTRSGSSVPQMRRGPARARQGTTTLAQYAHWLPQEDEGHVEPLAARRAAEAGRLAPGVGTERRQRGSVYRKYLTWVEPGRESNPRPTDYESRSGAKAAGPGEPNRAN